MLKEFGNNNHDGGLGLEADITRTEAEAVGGDSLASNEVKSAKRAESVAKILAELTKTINRGLNANNGRDIPPYNLIKDFPSDGDVSVFQSYGVKPGEISDPKCVITVSEDGNQITLTKGLKGQGGATAQFAADDMDGLIAKVKQINFGR